MANTKKPFSILLIDPKGENLETLTQYFTENTAYPTQLIVSKTISEAIDNIGKNHYHVILSNLSFSDGEDIADFLTEIHRRKITTPLLLLISKGEESQAHRAMKAGATDYIVKTRDELSKLSERLWSIYRHYELTNQDNLANEISLQNRRLMEVNESLRKLSIRDELTGLYNHRYLQERLAEEFTRAVRYSYPLSCLMLDLDLFRRVNETLGHAVGDEILKEVSGFLLESSRLSDLMARFGGEEFVILLPHVDYPGAMELAERLRALLAERCFLSQSHRIHMTVSIGVSCFPDDSMKDRTDLLNFADQALLHSKAAGRNQITLYRHILPKIGEMLPHLEIREEKILEFQKKLSEIANQARRGYIESSKALIMALESKDPTTAGHAGRTGRLALQVAEAMGLSLDEAEIVEHTGLLHDIGKICVADDILLKPKRFTLAEYEAMKQHPYFGYRIVEPIRFLQKEATLILHHHEWFNGQGYPCRLKRNEIPLGARIVAVVDSYDTIRLAGSRYKKTLPVDEAVNELIGWAGTQFDPEVVQAFIQVLVMQKDLSPDAYNKKRLQKTLGSLEKK